MHQIMSSNWGFMDRMESSPWSALTAIYHPWPYPKTTDCDLQAGKDRIKRTVHKPSILSRRFIIKLVFSAKKSKTKKNGDF